MENGTAGQPAAEAPRKPKLTRLKIEHFRNVAPCELRFGDGFNVLLGLNATGKTTLLELIAAALSFDFSKFKEEAFAVEYELAFSTGTIVASVRSERMEWAVREAPLLPFPEVETFSLSAKLHIRRSSPADAWTVCADMSSMWIEGKNAKIPVRTLARGGRGLLRLATEYVADGPAEPPFGRELSLWDSARRFDEALDMFRDITSPLTWFEAWVDRAGKVVHGFTYGGAPLPGAIPSAIRANLLDMPADSQGLTLTTESLNFLRAIVVLFEFKTARLEMRLESKTGGKRREKLKFSDFRFMFEDHDGSVIRHEDLSYGQKRLLAFYYYLAASPMTVIADEIVDGLHHLWIDAAIAAIGDRQAFLASQNPLLLDHLEFASAEDVASTFVTCRTERTGNEKHMIWSNLSPYDAERFFRAYQVDVQHVSEILLSKGLW